MSAPNTINDVADAAQLDGNPLSGPMFSAFAHDAVIGSFQAREMYEAATAVSCLAELLSAQVNEVSKARDGCKVAAPLNSRLEDGLLCALRVCADLLVREMCNLKDVDDKSAAINKGAA